MREKIVASVSDVEIIIADPTKVVTALGARPLPVAVVPFGWQSTRDRLEETFGCAVTVRKDIDGFPFISDDGLPVLDMHFGTLPDPDTLDVRLKSIVGVVESGLFVGLAHVLFIGREDGTCEVRRRG